MPALPRQKDTTRPRDCWAIMVLGGIEKVTEALRRGDAFDAQSVAEMQALCRRLDALKAALDERLSVLEEE